MGKRREKLGSIRSSQTRPPSPSHSSSSSDFEFTVSISPRAAKSSSTLCPADELFYKGQLLPLHLSPRLSMVHDLLLASSRTSSSSSSATASRRDSTGSSSNDECSRSSFASDSCDSSSCRPSSVVAEDDEFKRLNNGSYIFPSHHHHQIKKTKYFSLSRFSSVFKKENNKLNVHRNNQENMAAASSVKKISTTAKEVIRKYLKKVKPLYEKLSQKQQQQRMGETGIPASALSSTTSDPASLISVKPADRSVNDIEKINARKDAGFPLSFSGNLRYPRRRSCVSSCPSSIWSSPSHSGMLSRNGFPITGRVSSGGMTSSMEEFQSAIQGAIAHCKNSLL